VLRQPLISLPGLAWLKKIVAGSRSLAGGVVWRSSR
jgi:hypothetical protein